MNLLRTEPELFQYRFEERLALFVIGPCKRKCDCRPAPDCRIECIETVSAHNNDGWNVASCQIIHPTYERIDAGTVLMVHLSQLPRLRERIGFVDQQHYPRAVLSRSEERRVGKECR